MRTDAFTHRSSYTGTPLHTHTRICFYTKRFCTDKFLHTDAFTRRNLYTQTFLHTEVFTPKKKIHTQKLLHRGSCTETFLHTKVLHTNFFTVTNCYTELHLHRSFDTEQFANIYKDFFCKKKYAKMPLHTEVTEVFTQRRFGAQKLTRRNLYMQKFLHKCTKMFYRRATFTHIFFYTEKPKQLHRAGFSQRRFYTEKLLHRAVFTNRSFHTEKPFHRNKIFTEQLLHASKTDYYISLSCSTLISCEPAAPDVSKWQFCPSF